MNALLPLVFIRLVSLSVWRFLTPLPIWIQEMLSWHWVFIVTGGIGIIWSLIWFKVYQPPRLTKGISKAELDYIRDGGGLVDGDAPVKKEARQPLTAKDWKLVFHRKLIGVYLGQFAVASTLWFFLTWFPNYLTQEKGITALKAGFMTTVPFLAAFIGVLLSGWVADLLVRKGFSLGFARKKNADYLRLADLHLHYGCELHQRSDDDYVPDGAGILRQRFCFDNLVAGLFSGTDAPDWFNRRRV